MTQPTLDIDATGEFKRPEPEDEPQIDEGTMFQNLKKHFPQSSYALLRHVANGTGARSYRWADAIAMSIWPSRGLEIHGVEIKVSRSDWISELRAPEKADEIARYCDHWWLAVPGKKGAIVRPGELPSGWGLMRWIGAKFVIERAAPKQKPDSLDRVFLAAILRRAQEQLPTEAILLAEYKRGKTDQAQADIERHQENRVHDRERIGELQSCIQNFENASGIHLNSYDSAEAKALGLLVSEARRRGAPYFERRLRELGESARRLAEEAERQVKLVNGTSTTCQCSERSYNRGPNPNCPICEGTGLIDPDKAHELRMRALETMP